jgi:hypothetical protein
MVNCLFLSLLTAASVVQLSLGFAPSGPMRLRTARTAPSMILPDYPPPGVRKNYPRPDFEGTSQAQRDARDFSNSFNYGVAKNKPLKVAIIGGGLSGLSTAKYLTDAGHIPTVYEGIFNSRCFSFECCILIEISVFYLFVK